MEVISGNLKDHLEKLYAFSVIARTGSITHAAKRVHTSQAALSRSMIALEAALGKTLLKRERTGVRLTEAGQILFDFSKKLLLDLESVESNLSPSTQSKVAKLRVGTHEALAINLWPAFLEKLSKSHPEVSVSLMSGRIDSLTQGLLNREFHLILTVEPNAHSDFKIHTLFETTLGFYKSANSVTRKHPILKKSVLSLDDLNQVSILTDTSAHLAQGISVPRYLVQNGLKLDNVFELNSFEASLRLCAKGLGVAVLPKKSGDEAVKKGLLRNVHVKNLTERTFGMHRVCITMLRDENDSSPTAKLFRELTQIF